MKFTKKQLGFFTFSLILASYAFIYTSAYNSQLSDSRFLTSYTTQSTRSASVNSFCNGLTRSTLVDSSQQSANTFYKSQMANLLPIDGNTLINQALTGDYASVQATLKSNAAKLAGFIGPFIVGFVVILLLSPFLLCCCACPDSCPSKCCRKNEDEQYTRCELYWPTVTLVLALLLCIGACVAGLSQASIISSSINSMSCATSIVLDDILNGNVTTNGSSFFVGLNQLYLQLGYLNSNLSAINTTMQNLQSSSTNMTNVNNLATTALSDIAKIPANVNSGGNMGAISYSTPLNSASPSSTITSNFPSILGSSTTGGYLGTLYSVVSAAQTSLSTISSSATSFVSETTNFQNGVSAMQLSVKNFANFLGSADDSSYDYLNSINSKQSLINLAVKLVYGVTIGFAVLMLVGTLLVAFCDLPNCRYLMYFACFILFIIGIVGFILTLLFSFITPVVYFGCQFIDYSLSSSANFHSNFQNIISDSNFRSYVSTCLPTSSGDLISAIGGSSVNAIQNLSGSLTGIQSFNVSYQVSSLQQAMSVLTTVISNYKAGVLLDITDSSSISILTSISTASSYSSCTATGFSSDSWIPSDSQNPSYIACRISSGNNATSSSCSGGNFATRGGTCNGCMDTTSILNTGTYSNTASVLAALTSRYPGCTTFNNDLSNIWNNYYLVKSNSFSPITSRASTASTSLTAFTDSLTNTIDPTFTNAISSLTSIASSVTDPKYGLVAGLNCQLFGQDIQRAANTFCLSVFNISYFSRLVLGLASFGILFANCCGICTGVRFLKHSVRKLNSLQNAGLSEDQVEDVTNMNFVKPKTLE